MADEKKRVSYIQSESKVAEILQDFYLSTNKSLDFDTMKVLIQEDAAKAKERPDIANYSKATEAQLAYLYNYEAIIQIPELKDSKPLAPDDKVRSKNSGAPKVKEPTVLESMPRDDDDNKAIQYFKSNEEEIISRANKSAILKLIQVHRPKAELLVNKKDPKIFLDNKTKLGKAQKVVDDEKNLVPGEENQKAYEEALTIIKSTGDSELPMNIGKPSSAWAGVQVRKDNNETVVMSRSQLYDYLIGGNIAINIDDKTRPGAKLRWVKAKAKKDAQAEEPMKSVVALTNMKVVKDNREEYYTYATKVNPNKQVITSATSALSYKVFAVDENGNKKINTATGKERVSTKRLPGAIKVYEEEPIKDLWSTDFDKKATTRSGGANKLSNREKLISEGFLASAKALNRINKNQQTGDPLKSSGTVLSKDIQQALAAIDFNATSAAAEADSLD